MRPERSARRRSRLVLSVLPNRTRAELSAVQSLWRTCTPKSVRKGTVTHVSRVGNLPFSEVGERSNHLRIIWRNAMYVLKHGYERKRLWRSTLEKPMRCGGVFPDNPLQSMYAEGLLPAIRKQVRYYLSPSIKLEYSEVVTFAQICGEAQRRMHRLNTLSVTAPYRTINRPQRKW